MLHGRPLAGNDQRGRVGCLLDIAHRRPMNSWDNSKWASKLITYLNTSAISVAPIEVWEWHRTDTVQWGRVDVYWTLLIDVQWTAGTILSGPVLYIDSINEHRCDSNHSNWKCGMTQDRHCSVRVGCLVDIAHRRPMNNSKWASIYWYTWTQVR